jgi:hypothetical protein
MTPTMNNDASRSPAPLSMSAKLTLGFIAGVLTVLLSMVLGLIPAIAIGGGSVGVVSRVYVKLVSRRYSAK